MGAAPALGLALSAREWFRRGYWDNRFEVEAREFTEDHLYRFRAWLAQDRGQPPESRDV
ncbi:MAG: hypothetical protein H7A16_00115 [Sinobacteraceae bacterium]|nr:hypothetical protein [Nevskiaceae bacterium]